MLPVDAAGLTLARDGTFGELDVRALLAVFGVPRLDHVGTGWGGGRTAIYRRAGSEVVALALDWDTELDALEWAEAIASYVNEAFDATVPGLPAQIPCDASACWQVGARGIAFERAGARTALVIGVDTAQSASVARALLGLG